MKRMALALVALFVMAIQASAMSYEQAREQALFLTDKMAYELNLTDDQYEAAYEINLDYLMGVNSQADLYGSYWTRRNLDLSYVLLDWQYQSYLAASYFYRPLYWEAGYWHFGIYARYPHRSYFYFGRPAFYDRYRGGHAWHMNGGRSWYHGRSFGGPRGGQQRIGMRDGFDRGDYGRGHGGRQQGTRSFGNGTRGGQQGGARPGQEQGRRQIGGATRGTTRGQSTQQGTRTFGRGTSDQRQTQPRSVGGDQRQSSTRTTATRQGTTRRFGDSSQGSTPRSTFTPRNTQSTQPRSSSSGGGSRTFSSPTRSTGGGASMSRGGGGGGTTRSAGGHFGRGR